MATDPATPDRRTARGQARTQETRAAIQQAMAALLEADGSADSLTYKRVAAAARVTEMTVYRHFPTREALLEGLWRHMNQRMGEGVGMPTSLEQLLGQHATLHRGFDRIPAQITASVVTDQGREMRSTLNETRRSAFLAISKEIAPKRSRKAQKELAALLQLLHSAHAWMSMREQWDMDGSAVAAATRWAIDALIETARREGGVDTERTRTRS